MNVLQSIVKNVAPLLGAVLGGPATLAQAATSLIASKLGLDDDPDEIAAVLKADPGRLLELKALEDEHRTELEKMRLQMGVAELQLVNQTMRVEYQTEGWYKTGWRPFIGWVMGVNFLGISAGLVYILVKDPTKIQDIAAVIIWLVGAGATILGVNIRERTKGKLAAQGIEPESLVSDLVSRFKR